MRMKLGNMEIKITNDKYKKKSNHRENPFEAMLLKFDRDFFRSLHKEIPPSLADYFKECKNRWKSIQKG